MKARLLELTRFGGVGLVATLVHTLLYLAAVRIVSPQLANLVGFAVAVAVSYFAHRDFTFRADGRTGSSQRATILRFGVTALVGLLLNAGFVAFTTRIWKQPPETATLFILFVTPGITFLLLKFWAFRPSGDR